MATGCGNGLKLDRCFIQAMSESEKDATLVAGVTALCRKLGMRVVAEGVETEAQLERLRELGCGYGQGYLFAPPLSPEQAHAFIAENRTKRADGT